MLLQSQSEKFLFFVFFFWGGGGEPPHSYPYGNSSLNSDFKKIGFWEPPLPPSEIKDTPIHTYPIVLDFLTKILIAKRSPWLKVNNFSVLKSQRLHQSVYS